MNVEEVQDGRRGHFYMYDDIIDIYGKELGAFGLAVYTMLCRRAGKNGEAYPSLRRMAGDLGISESQARRELKKLRTMGLISIQVRRSEQGRQMSSVYTILETPRPTVSQNTGTTPTVCETPPGVSHRHPKDYPHSKDYSSKELFYNSLSGELENPASPTLEKEHDEEQRHHLAKESSESRQAGKPQDLKQYAVAQLMERVTAAQARGAPVHEPPGSDRGQYGKFFAWRAKKYDIDTLLTVLDYLVAKAAGEIEGEPKAWCGFDTALDAVVLTKWHPGNGQRAAPASQASRPMGRRNLNLEY